MDSSVEGSSGTILLFFALLVPCVVAAFYLGQRFAGRLGRFVAAADAIGAGNLATRLQEEGFAGERELGAAMNRMAASLAAVISDIQANGTEVDRLSSQAFDVSSDFAARNEEQAASIEDTANTIHELTRSVSVIADNLALVKASSERTLESALKGKSFVQDGARTIGISQERICEVAGRLSFLTEKSVEIEGIVADLNRIARTTNMISLNASIEAVAAGEGGQRFAVVAEEIRKLAFDAKGQMERVQATLSQVTGAIREAASASAGSEVAIAEAGKNVQSSTEAFGEIVGMIREVDEASGSIAQQVQEQGAAHRQVADHIEHLSRSVSQSAHDMQTHVALVAELTEKAEALAKAASGVSCPASP